jgi:murein L,D-transpeptidase YafK
MMIAALVATLATTQGDPCAGQGTAVVVDTAQRALLLCDEGRVKASHAVALGSGGVDKRVEGDAKVPLGTYPLGKPRASSSFNLFIPVGYPTAEQRRQGYTGSAIGVHGPARLAQGASSTAVDWTLGCIAVGTDDEIEAIARWVNTRRVKRITILPR